MNLETAVRFAIDALGFWAEYLEENDREDETSKFDEASGTLIAFKRLLQEK